MAVIYLEIGRKSEQTRDYTLADTYLLKADDLFQICKHRIGSMEVQLIFLSRPVSQESDFEVVNGAFSLLQKSFSEMRYRSHELLTLRAMVSKFQNEYYKHDSTAVLLQRKVQKLSYQLVTRLFWTLAQGLLVALVTTIKVINARDMESILRLKLMIPIAEVKFQLCLVISLEYTMTIEDGPAGAHWPALALRFARKTGSRKRISQANCHYLVAMSQVVIAEQDRLEVAKRLKSTWLLAIDKDRDEGLIEEQFNLCSALFLARQKVLLTAHEIDVVLEEAESIAEMLSAEKDDDGYISNICSLQAELAVARGDYASAVNGCKRALFLYSQKKNDSERTSHLSHSPARRYSAGDFIWNRAAIYPQQVTSQK
jgi:hypothetical protein